MGRKKKDQPIPATTAPIVCEDATHTIRFLSTTQRDILLELLRHNIAVGMENINFALRFSIDLNNHQEKLYLSPSPDGYGFREARRDGSEEEWSRFLNVKDICLDYFSSCCRYVQDKSEFKPNPDWDYDAWVPLLVKYGFIKEVKRIITEYEICKP